MRVLHAIQPDEILVCRGEYHYLSDGEPTGDIESWLLTQTPDGQEIMRADVDGRKGSGASLVSHLLRDFDDSLVWLRLRYRDGKINAAAQYTFEKAGVRVARLAEGYVRRQGIIEIAANYVIDYHPVICHDYVWRGYPEDAGGEMRAIPVFSPDLWADSENVLAGRALRFNVTPLPLEPCPVPAGHLEVSRHFSIVLNDGVKAEAWFGPRGIPLRWVYPEKAVEFVLVSYQYGNGI